MYKKLIFFIFIFLIGCKSSSLITEKELCNEVLFSYFKTNTIDLDRIKATIEIQIQNHHEYDISLDEIDLNLYFDNIKLCPLKKTFSENNIIEKNGVKKISFRVSFPYVGTNLDKLIWSNSQSGLSLQGLIYYSASFYKEKCLINIKKEK
jgi:hypothetical protein